MKTQWKIVLMLERRIEFKGAMILMPFVKLQPVDLEGDMFVSIPGGKVVYVPEKIDVREVLGAGGVLQTVKHTVIAADTVVDSITAPDGAVFKLGEVVPIDLAPVVEAVA